MNSNTIQNRIEALLAQLGVKPQRASLDAGMSKDALRKLLAKPGSKPSAEMLEGLNKAYGVSMDWLLHGGSETPVFDRDLPPKSTAQDSRNGNDGAARIPIRGSVAASYISGKAGADDATIGEVQMPPSLAHIKGIYALYVDGSSMEPQFFPGDLIFLNPSRPARKGDCVVIVTDHGTGPQRSLGIYNGETGETVHLKKRDPGRPEGTDIAIPKKFIKARHKVLTVNEIFGA